MLKIERIAIPAQHRTGKYAETIVKMTKGDSVAFATRSKASGFAQALRRAGFASQSRNIDGKFRVWHSGKAKK